MADIFTEIKRRYLVAPIYIKFIYINVGIFLLIRLTWLFMALFLKNDMFSLYLQMPSSPILFLHRPWTILTYMFVHVEILHILFNMLWLYWFGRIFMEFFTGRQLGGLYLLGGIAGGALYFLCFNLLPALKPYVGNSFLLGASASVMAIVFAVAFYQKNYQINLLIIGRIKLIYLALGVFILDLIAITHENPGGHIAHIGGSLLGILFAVQYIKGKDITQFINRLIDGFVNRINQWADFKRKRKPKFKMHRSEYTQSRRPETDDEYLRRKNEENRVIDEILDKLKRSGYESLSADEKKRLFNASKK